MTSTPPCPTAAAFSVSMRLREVGHIQVHHMNKAVLLLAILVLHASCNRHTSTPRACPIVWKHAVVAAMQNDFSEKSLRTLQGVGEFVSEDSWEIVRVGETELSFHSPSESYEQTKEKFGVGSFDEWCNECGIEAKKSSLNPEKSEFSIAFLYTAGKVLIIDNGRYKWIIVYSKYGNECWGRIWDESRKVTWAIQGRYIDSKEIENLIDSVILLTGNLATDK